MIGHGMDMMELGYDSLEYPPTSNLEDYPNGYLSLFLE
jgi:hypothetical protein